ncbi:MAG TPA: prepilin-type N-terminal cleavage/methylation domain-containing protein, partial [Casimicrobiaceae bacterium]|nr:prepilin-type N-terminal cleavage/methylation domain-containing protein [Casimicrobiaceae bacterium]
MRGAVRTPPRPRTAGVTLIELLVVLALMALLATIALPVLGPGVSTMAM